MAITLQRILAQALRDPRSFASLRTVLASDLANPNPFHRQIIEFATSFYTQYEKLPQRGDYEIWTSGLNSSTQGAIVSELSAVLSLPEEDWTPDYIVGEVTKSLKENATRVAVSRLSAMVPNVPADALATLNEEIKKIEPVTINGLKNLRDVHRWVYHRSTTEDAIPTGIPALDSHIQGIGYEMGFVVADAGIGKSTLLINFGAEACLRGKEVLHITYEVSAENTLTRYYRRISESTGPEIRFHPELVINKVEHWLRFAKGSVRVLYQPPYEIGDVELQALVDQYILIYGKPDLVLLDYLDLMKPPRDVKDAYEGLGRLTHRVRNLGIKHGFGVWSATQASRQAHTAKHLRLDMMGDSYNKVRGADIILAVNQTPEEFEANQGRLGILKVRENPGKGIEVPVYINMDYMMVADLDHPNSQRIIAALNHPPTKVFTE